MVLTMFKPTPTKLTKEQLDALINQTIMFKEYFSNLELCLKTGKDGLEFFPFMAMLGFDDHIDYNLEQAEIYKNYFCMTEMYLKLIRSNLDLWHSMYIDPKKK